MNDERKPPMLDKNKAIVILSGGQDSTTALFWAIEKYGRENVSAFSVNYGQRHVIEIGSTMQVSVIADVPYEVQCIPGDALASTSPLLDKTQEVEEYEKPEDMPGGIEPTFVPMRNLLFLVLAANRAVAKGAGTLVIGVSEEDFGGYPDCRNLFLQSASLALGAAVGLDSIGIAAPLLHLDKEATVRLAKELGEDCWRAMAHTHTCYNGRVPPCGKCHACILRSIGFTKAKEIDPLIVRAINEHRACYNEEPLDDLAALGEYIAQFLNEEELAKNADQEQKT